MSKVDEVTTTLNFFVDAVDGSPPYSRLYDDGSGTPAANYALIPQSVQVENVRERMDSFELHTAGFQFYTHGFQDVEFYDDKAVETRFLPEVVEVIKNITGASRIVVFEHIIRRHRPDYKGGPVKFLQPAKSFPHADQTTPAAIARVNRHLPAEEAKQLLQKRFQIINFWRPITHTALDWPLALCDYRSVDPEKDLVPISLIYRDRKGEIFAVKYNPEHKWKYVKGMRVDEFVLFKSFDSIQDGGMAVTVPHAAFEDQSTPKDAPLRESVEVRMFLSYD